MVDIGVNLTNSLNYFNNKNEYQRANSTRAT